MTVASITTGFQGAHAVASGILNAKTLALLRFSAALAFPIIALPISKIPSDFSPETLPPTGCVFNLTSSSFTDLKIKLATRWQLFGKALGLIGLWNVRW